MTQEADRMADDPLDRYEELIVAELSSYQSQLDLGSVPSSDDVISGKIPAEVQQDLDDFRDCLELISIRRKGIQGDLSAGESVGSEVLPDDSAPFHIGRFEIAEQLGVGGFGIVFRGIDPVMDREVAIKIPRPEFLGSQELTDRFACEAAAVTHLDHPNIVPIYESDCLDLVPYIVMPYIPGKTLAQWRADELDVSPRTAAEIVRQLANAVAHAHERGVLHRDLKPGNVLLAQREAAALGDGLPFVPKLTDFGLAKSADTDRPDTRTGTMIGTASYMSPEQVEGRSRDITSRSDIYGLGVVLYELLTGAPPFHDANQLRTIQKVLRDEPPSLRSGHVKVPIDLEVICLKCLEKSPIKRYASAGALADDLQCFLHGEPIQARPIPLISRIGKWSKRNPATATLIAAIVLCLMAIEGVSLRYNGLLNSLQNVVEVERRTRHETAMIAKRRAYVSDMRNAKVVGDHNNISQMLTLLERYRMKPAEPDIRDFAWWHLSREYEESSRVLGTHDRAATSVAMTRDGRLAASGGMDSIIQIWSLPDGELIGSLCGHQAGAVESVSFSPNGERLASAGEDGTVRVWDVATYEQVFVCEHHESQVFDVMYSPQGDVIASSGADHSVRLWDPETGEQIGVLIGHSDSVRCLAFHPTEPTLVTGGRDSRICFWDWKNRCSDSRIEGGAIQLPSLTQWPRSLVFEPDGNSLVVGVTNAMVFRFNLEPGQYGKEVAHRRSLNGSPNSLAWPRDGPLIMALGNSEIHLSDRFDPSLPGEWKRGHQGAVVSVAVSADGVSMVSASADGEIRYWPDFQNYSRINIARDKGAEWNDERRVYEVQWRNQYLAADFQQREVALYRMPENTLERTIPKADEDGFVLSPSGKTLLIFQMNGLVTCYKTDVEQPLWTQQLSPRTQPFFTEFSAIDNTDNLAVVAWGNDLLVLSMLSPQILRRFNHPGRVWQVAFAEDEYRFAIPISACHDGYIRFWDLAYARIQKSLRANIGPTYSVAVSDDHQFLATAGEDYTVRVWRYRSLEPIAVLPSGERPGPSRIGFLKGLEGSEILVRQNFQLSLWGIPDEAELLAFPDCGQFGSLSISPDGKQLAVPQHGWVRLIDGRQKFQSEDGRIHF
jgi:serine/threonine protein kinase/WD40 repeat protein